MNVLVGSRVGSRVQDRENFALLLKVCKLFKKK